MWQLTTRGGSEGSVAFSPTGTTLATSSNDGSVILWDLANPAKPRRLGQPLMRAASPVAFSPSGTTLATGSDDGGIILWDLTALNNLRDHATERGCSITGGGLDRDEWARYISGLPYQNTCST
ncbi:MAG: WD40 repeat domain-containing protein [Pseudonocardiaceae bacterium]